MSRSLIVRSWIACLLALVLVVAQQAALAHGIAHAVSLATGDDPGLPHSKVCDQCNQASNLGLGMVSEPARLDCNARFHSHIGGRVSVHDAAWLPPFSSRAPPTTLLV